MFRFGSTHRDPFADIKSAERWFASFPDSDPLALHAALLAELGQFNEQEARRTPARLETVFFVDGRASALRRSLTKQYVDHARRSPKIENQLWSALFDLTQAFLLVYQSFAREVTDHPQSAKWQLLLPGLVARQIIHLGQDAKIRQYRYEQWIPAKWTELHALFSLACSRQVDRQQIIVGTGGSTTTIEHEYLVTLLLQLMNSGNMTARHLEWVAGELDEWCAPLRITLEASSVTSFYVDLGAREGLRRRAPGPLEGRVLFLDTRPLHAVLMQNVIVLEQKIKGEPLSDRTSRRSEQLDLMSKLASQVDPEFRPIARRGERSAANGAVDAIVGFGKICAFLKEEERAPTPQLETGKSFGGTMELAVFGRMRNEPDRRVDVVRQRLALYAAPGGPWDVKDVSQTGFRLIAPMSAASTITLGTLAAIRPHGQSPWTLGIVRRMRRLTSDRAELGLQIIANTLVGVDLVEQRKNADRDYSVDGEQTTINGRTFQGLFLTLRKRESDVGVQSLIVPVAEYQPANRLKLMTAKSIDPIRYGRLIEQQPDWVWATVEPMNLHHTTFAPTIGGLPPLARTGK
jgi:cyclic-di-GMP-binding protein